MFGVLKGAYGTQNRPHIADSHFKAKHEESRLDGIPQMSQSHHVGHMSHVTQPVTYLASRGSGSEVVAAATEES